MTLLLSQIGPYRIDSLIGRGGMAEVYKAWHLGLHRHEALKLLPPQMTLDHMFVERFLSEARTAAGLHHPHIATIHTVSEVDAAQPFFTMELVEGIDLSDMIRQRGCLPLEEALPILRQVAGALDYAHSRSIVHRDVKPGNVLLAESGDQKPIVKLVDFGIARAQEAQSGARLTRAGMIVGTPEYMSPEQAGSGPVVDGRSDQYSLAAVAYEMLCGHPPFVMGLNGSAVTVIMSHIREQPRPLADLLPGVGVGANLAVLKALAKTPEERFSSCQDFVEAMEQSASSVLTSSHFARPSATPPSAVLSSRPQVPVERLPGASAPAMPLAASPAHTVKARTTSWALGIIGSSGLLLAGLGVVRSYHATPPILPPVIVPQPSPAPNPPPKQIGPDNKALATQKAEQASRLLDTTEADMLKMHNQAAQGLVTVPQARQAATQEKSQFRQALRFADASLLLDRSNDTAWVQKIKALLYLGRVPAAKMAVDEAVRRFPGSTRFASLFEQTNERLKQPHSSSGE